MTQWKQTIFILWGKEIERVTECIVKEIMSENFPNLGKETDIQIHEATQTPNKLNLNKIVKRQWQKILRAAKAGSWIQGNSYKTTGRFLIRNFPFQERMEWQHSNGIKAFKENCRAHPTASFGEGTKPTVLSICSQSVAHTPHVILQAWRVASPKIEIIFPGFFFFFFSILGEKGVITFKWDQNIQIK